MRRFVESHGFVPLLFFILTVIAYGLLLPFTGFYWDDWPFAWIARFLGPGEFVPAFRTFRPFLGPIFMVTTSLVPPVPIAWQIFALIIRFLLVVASWWMFRGAWPDRPGQSLAASLLVLVFPGYSQHWVAFTHINQELIPLIFYVLSLGLTMRAVRLPKPHVATAAALLLQVLGLFATEYFFGLELMRPFLLLIAQPPGPTRQRLLTTGKTWLPYCAVWLANALWLFWYYRYGPYSSYEVAATEALSAGSVATQLVDAVWKAGVFVWVQIVPLVVRAGSSPTALGTVALVVLTFIGLAAYLRQIDVGPVSRRTVAPLLMAGVIGILAGRLPSLAAGLPLRLQSSYDRFMISMLLGGSLFALGLLQLALPRRRAFQAALAVVISLGVGQQFFNANIFRRDWETQGRIYRQLAWRIPALAPGTLLLTHQMPVDYETDLSFTAPINWMYAADDFAPPRLLYALLYTEKRLGGPTLPALEPDIPVRIPYRTVEFSGNTGSALVIYMPSAGCLRVLEQDRGDQQYYGRESRFLTEAIPLSDPSLIKVDARRPAEPIFFNARGEGWCFAYERAELARQQRDWQGIVTIEAEARALGHAPEDPIEWLPFVEAHARTGDWDGAFALGQQAIHANARVLSSVCTLYSTLKVDSMSAADGEAIDRVLRELACPPLTATDSDLLPR